MQTQITFLKNQQKHDAVKDFNTINNLIKVEQK